MTANPDGGRIWRRLAWLVYGAAAALLVAGAAILLVPEVFQGWFRDDTQRQFMGRALPIVGIFGILIFRNVLRVIKRRS